MPVELQDEIKREAEGNSRNARCRNHLALESLYVFRQWLRHDVDRR